MTTPTPRPTRPSHVAAGAVATLLAAAAMTSAPAAARADVQPQATMLRFPDIGPTHICFVYANDIWLVPREGGVATPLASPPGLEQYPRFSPDGKTVAFVGNYEGNRDLYTMPVDGGIPTRVTHHPSTETLADWTPDGRLLFMTSGLGGLGRMSQLWTVAASGGLPTQMPVPYGGFGAVSPNGTLLAYTPHSTDNRTWKRYRGGMATDVWVYNVKDDTSRKITDWEGTDTIPMWVPGGGGKDGKDGRGKSKGDDSVVYYLSDNGPEHRLNLWSFDLDDGERTQLTKFEDDDVRWPSVGPGERGKGEIIFQLGSELRVLDLATKKDRVVKVAIPGDRPTVRPRTIDASKFITGASISPSGKRVAIEARGDIWSAPAKEGVVRNLTRTDGVYERYPVWSPDGKSIAYFSDESGEYELYVRPSDGRPPDPKDKDEKKDDDKKDEDKSKVAKKDDDRKADDDEKDDGGDAADAKEAAPVPAQTLLRAGEPRKLTAQGAGFRNAPTWSPDSKRIAFLDEKLRVLVADAATGDVDVVDTDPWDDITGLSWSSDSRWLAYARSDEGNTQRCVWLWNADSGERTRVTSPMFNSYAPCFDRKGEHLFFVSNRSIEDPVYSDIDQSFAYAGTEQLFATTLRKDLKNPFGPKSDEEEIKKDDAGNDDDKKDSDEKKEGGEEKDDGKDDQSDDDAGDEKDDDKKKDDEKKDDEKKDDAKARAKKDKDAPKEVKIDLDGIERRVIAVPIDAGSFGRVGVTHDHKLMYVRQAASGSGGDAMIKILDLSDETREEKDVVKAGGFELSADGKKFLIRRGGSAAAVHEATAGGGKPTTVVTAGMTASIDPRDEWKQIFQDVWRMYRDLFYDGSMHGVDWAAMRAHYGAMIEDCVSREDVAFVLGELISELNVGHAYVTGPGDVQQQPTTSVGMLGCDYELVGEGDDAAYRISRIYEGGPWDADARGPLSAPGVNVEVGDYLLAVDGIPVDTSKDPWAAFVDTADRPTTITVSKSPAVDDSTRDVLVKPLGGEGSLRFRWWIEQKRAAVEKASGGKVGYVYVPNTGVDGQNELFRQYYGQRDKAAMIIDERWNGGGQIPTRFIELLNRPLTNLWARRYGADIVWPPDAHNGPKCMLINGLAGSGGDAFPWYFRQAGLGKLIGTRTWGGLVGIGGKPPLMDGGGISVPDFAFYKKNGTWGVEGHGVDPDIEVIDDPAKMTKGRDPQLDRAVELMLEEIKARPFIKAKRPGNADRSRMGIPEADR